MGCHRAVLRLSEQRGFMEEGKKDESNFLKMGEAMTEKGRDL